VLIGHDGVLPVIFGRVLTVPAVVAELNHHGSPEVVRTWAAAPPSWLTVQSPTSVTASLGLGRGEVEAISLATELRADAILIDERKGARAASSLGLFVTGTLGVLQLAHEWGLLRLSEAVAALRSTSFRASDDLLDEMVRRSAEPVQRPDEGP
jgi:predicted nucleic acid-binding protein